MRRLLGALARYGLSLFCLLYAFRGVPLDGLWGVLRQFPVCPMFKTVLIAFAAYALMGVRLTRMNEPPLRFRSTFCATLAGLALNNIFPAKAGEVAKAAWIGRDHGLPLDASLGIVFMERFFDVNILAFLSLWFIWDLGRRRAAALLLLGVAGGWGTLLLYRRRPGWTSRFERLPLPGRVTGFLTRFSLALVEQLTPRRIAWTAGSSVAVWTLYALQMAAAFNGVAGLGLGWGEMVGVFALSSLGMLLPSSPGAVGVYEAVAVTALTAYNVPRDQALAATLFAHMVQLIPVTLAGALVLSAFPGAGRSDGERADPLR